MTGVLQLRTIQAPLINYRWKIGHVSTLSQDGGEQRSSPRYCKPLSGNQVE